MSDYYWPATGLTPFGVEFYLQPHTERTVSPFSRQQKTYGLSADLWKARLQVRGGYDGEDGLKAVGPAMDALLARLKGGQHRVGFWDFRRPEWRGMITDGIGNNAASKGDATMILTGLTPAATVLAGDYIGGDGRPHIIVEDATVAGDGTATVTFEPALNADMAIDHVVAEKPLGWFRLVSDDAGANAVQVGDAVVYDLEFVEDPLFAPTAEPTDYLMIGGILILIGDYLEI